MPPPPLLAPDELPPALRDHPRYRLLRQLGKGGMGVVYQAEHRVMERLVAVKVIGRALVDNPQAVERFNREVRAAAKLDHPNIVKAYDAETAGELQLLVMEHVEGLSLADVLAKKGPLPVAHACHYVRQAAQGLQHAHEQGMVHRDIKPSNLMLTPKGTVKILDFGLAKLLSDQPRAGGLTSANVVMGTPEFLAPEQALNTRTADGRADVYALGCTLFYLLAGRAPFPLTDDTEVMLVFLKHLNEPPPDLRALRPQMPADLAALVARMLAKDPAARPQTAREVAAALAPFARPGAAAPTVPTAPAMTETRAAIPPARPVLPRRWLVPIGAAALTALVFAGLWAGGAFAPRVPTGEGTVVLSVSEPGAEVLLDGARVALSRPAGETVEFRTAPGRRTLEVRKDGFKAETRELTLDPGGRHELAVRLELAEAVPPAPVPAAAPPTAVPPATPPAVRAANRRATFFGERTWRVEGNELVQSGTGKPCGLLFGDPTWVDYDFAFEGQRVSGSEAFYATFRARDEENHGMFRLSGPGGDGYAVGRMTGGQWTRAVASAAGQIYAGPWYQVRVEVRGERVRCLLDGYVVFEYRDDLPPAGRVGLVTWGSQARFRNLRVTTRDGRVLWEGLPDLSATAAP